jgi:hypothetical protein
MLDAFKRIWSRQGAAPHWRDVDAWSRGHAFEFKRARADNGFVIEGSTASRRWRLEWGPSQRDYIVGQELRLRCELGLPQGMQLLVLSRPLMLELERETFARFTDGTQTKIDTNTPEEMRWLAMFPQHGFGDAVALRAHVGAVGSSRTALARWLDGELSSAISAAAQGVLAYPTPFVLMTIRGRLSLRIGLPLIDITVLDQALALFRVAADRALQVAEAPVETASAWPAGGDNAYRTLPADGGRDTTV